jgi:PAS domain S-box-containing protein
MAGQFQGYQSLVENSPDAISLINQRGEILYGSASNTALFGYEPGELVGRDCIELLHPDDRDNSSSLLNAVIGHPAGLRSWDARVRRKDGSYCWVESTVSNLVEDSEVQALVLRQRDIHERREAHANSLLQAEELMRSNLRMEEFAYTVAHDLREPLRAISLYTQLLCARVEMDANARELAEFVMEGARRMSSMISDLLTFAQTGTQAQPVLVNLEATVEQALKNLALEVQESGAVVTMEALPLIYSDEVQVLRIFQNLISNAIKYRSERPPHIVISAAPFGPDWIIKVKDNGVGIASEYLSKIFVPFVRLANRDIPGTGLGLAVCKKAIEGLGGNIWAESELGSGSTFTITMIRNISTSPPVPCTES